MAITINPHEIYRLLQFLDQYGIANMNDYQFVLEPSFRGLNLKVKLNVTYIPQNKTLTLTLDP